LLALYTLFFGARSSVPEFRAQVEGAARELHQSVAAQAKGRARSKREAPVAPTPAIPAAPKDTAASAPLTDMQAIPDESWGGDPFVRDWVMVNELANLSLKAITVGGERAYALVNDQILEAGDYISGKRIVSIETDKITLEQGGRTFTLMLGE
jgi:hypothetical protein